ncbi:SusC/RagA family TonB-linked outer membrane protein [Elizabethkingia anophelis]|uniref:SusC/RagA family TonB-linked outer membrane protein n=1 Tax=Elizabethkingia anophelis TaxID=1117645 RepID=UPI00077EAEDF|nr:SusC/RagA family TonB-linked outer membrane protein [Elizabethkingia anophelis]AMR42748.1 SusC/RagA family TonB-linked outer membrane protein [Elizabethkingia anophelis]AMX49391.1 SusC/RagA family TonB-linked outer membrane protein [Elizabethkingia anophelis]AMX52846.1 SusC/RagA family TonB-linked outer membrane protein [Elizabethkingia anophelis]AMX56240.1 SusC/RagA family TonB-linked outer membrane protein [Elizabethkingia anophelis]EGT4347043.1 SusC/RagA family TonB-linked outer membrane
MKKLTNSVLAVVLSSTFVMVSAQKTKQDTAKTKEIEGVVVTALGIKREKRALGYASQEIKGDLVSDAGQTNAVSALSGNVAGVQVTAPSTMGGSTRITMRGISSVTGENRPLIVVDGVPLDNSNINNLDTQRGAGGRDYGDASFDINPDDIESVTVLKGGPAAALYGARAGNGAIIYTTKSAKKGRTEIQLNSGISFENIYIRPELQSWYGGGSADVLPTRVINGKTYNVAEYATDASWGPKYNPNLMYLPWYAFDKEFASDYMKEVPWVAPRKDVDDFFKTGVTYTNNVSVSKSFGDTNVRLSYTNTNISGIIPTSKIKKDNFSVNLNTKLSENLKADAVFNYVHTEGFNRPEIGYGNNSVAQKFYQFGQRNLDFDKLKDYKLANGNQRTWNRTSWDNATPKYSDNPYWTINENTSEDVRQRFFGNAGLTYNFDKHFYIVGKVYGDVYSQGYSTRVAVGSQAVSNYTLEKRNVSEFNYEGRAHYNNNFGDFSVNAFAGFNIRDNKMSWIRGTTVGGLIIPGLYNLDNSKETARATNRSFHSSVKSIFGSVSLGYKDFLYLEATGRNDWFSTVNDDKFYPSVTASFVFSNVLKADWLSFGKIRAGWSSIAQGTDPYSRLTYATLRIPFGGAPQYSDPDISNDPNIKPEIKKTKEIGLEASFFKNRVSVDFTYYDVKSQDLIIPLPIDPSTGFLSKTINAGNMTNKGIEAMVNVTPIKTSDFSWNITWNYAQNRNKLVELKDDLKNYILTNAPFRVQLAAQIGQPYGVILGTDFVYDANGNKVIDGNGQYKASEIRSLGSILPKYNMGFRNTFKYKSLSLSFLIDIQQGGKYYSTTNMFGMYSGMLKESGLNGNREAGVILPGVREDGTPNNIKLDAPTWGAMYYDVVDALNVFDASYIKLRDITIGYELPKSIIGNTLEGVRISAFARNLFAWNLSNKGIDPENVSTGSGNIQGIEGGNLPSTRMYGFNINFKF